MTTGPTATVQSGGNQAQRSPRPKDHEEADACRPRKGPATNTGAAEREPIVTDESGLELRPLFVRTGVEDVHYSIQVINAGKLDADLTFARAQGNFHTGVEPVGQ